MSKKSTEQPLKQTKASRTRQRLLDSTAKVISERGFAGTRLADIGAVAEVQAPAIYYHYSSSDEMIEEVMQQGAATMLEHLETALAALPADADPVTRLSTAVAVHLRTELDLSDYSRAMVRNANQLPEHVGTRALELVRRYNALWRVLIDELAGAELLRPELDRSVARMLILGALNWAAEWFDASAGSIDDVIATAQSMIVHSLVVGSDDL